MIFSVYYYHLVIVLILTIVVNPTFEAKPLTFAATLEPEWNLKDFAGGTSFN